ncbi:hypothetical protein IU409_27975 [Nocardia cyriacigeorgica]|uniref:hypothetical protein n=1 Tax=Nocardia cyriacigeorgica TaxID=135487 RepID=UPI0018959260|nr:hypothetical protein [Nocardia cyriacigeorgica]MBF6347325.1 hypothetical protein [Nocardia cyriacigeorgica]
MGPEERLKALGVSFVELPVPPADPAHSGLVLVEPVGSEYDVEVSVKPGLTGAQRRDFAEWVVSRLERFVEHGPEPDGWRMQSDGRWQLWAAWRYLGTLDDD